MKKSLYHMTTDEFREWITSQETPVYHQMIVEHGDPEKGNLHGFRTVEEGTGEAESPCGASHGDPAVASVDTQGADLGGDYRSVVPDSNGAGRMVDDHDNQSGELAETVVIERPFIGEDL